jgi:predicted nucleotidyltransferase
MHRVEIPTRSSSYLQTGVGPAYYPSPVAEFGLSSRALQLLRDVLATESTLGRAIVYGSRAKGNFQPGSDIDIALDAPEMSFQTYQRLCSAVDDLNLPWEIDLALLSHISNPKLLDHITRVGKPLWVKPSTLSVSTC